MNERYHIVPNGDAKEHQLHAKCKCAPALEGNLVIHNAWDGREFFEHDHDEQINLDAVEMDHVLRSMPEQRGH